MKQRLCDKCGRIASKYELEFDCTPPQLELKDWKHTNAYRFQIVIHLEGDPIPDLCDDCLRGFLRKNL